MDLLRKSLKSEKRGVRIEFKYLKNIKTYDAVRIVLGVFLDDEVVRDDLGLKCLFNS